MTPLPKRKHSSQRQGKKRSKHVFVLPKLSECPNCHELKYSHRVCPECGFYNGREEVVKRVKKVKTEK